MAGGYGCRRPRMAAPSFTLPSSARSWRRGMAARKLVHIVDDEHAIRRSTSFMLQTAGYAVRTWPTGAAFLKEVRQAPEGCVLLDIRMPDMDGIAVRSEEHTSELQSLMRSSYAVFCLKKNTSIAYA